jgi:hypothetical protein
VIVLVTGSRNHDPIKVADHICEWVRNNAILPSDRIILSHGGAKGADKGAAIACERNPSWGEFRLPALWSIEGKWAGPVRNTELLGLLRPGRVLAYPLEGSVGTWDMIRKAQFQKIPVVIFENLSDSA